MAKILAGSGVHFPRWMRWAGMAVGVALLADGFRRFIDEGLLSASAFVIIGSACFYIAGYEKRVAVTETGFIRERVFWGRGRKECLSWDEMEEIVLFPSAGGTSVLFPLKEKGWRLFLPGVSEAEVRDHISMFGGSVPVRTGEATAD